MEEKFFREFNIQTLTPVHIGCGTEEKLKKDIDYITEADKVKLIDWNKLLNDEKNRVKVSIALVEGNRNEIKDIAKNNKALIETNLYINATEITRNLKNKLSNKPIIPGSSIKGSITSVLLEYFTRGFDGRKNLIEKTDKVLGSATIGNHFMRFLQFSDVEFKDNTIIETKVFNLRDIVTGGWKHGPNNTNLTFKNNGFVFAYEVIPDKSISKIYIGFNVPAFKLAEKVNLVNLDGDNQIITAIKEKQNQIINNKISELFRIINEHAKSYIEKELKFYDSIKNEAEYQDEIRDFWENLNQEVEEAIKNGNKYCILRVGFGSGFHSITGDWWFGNSHEVNLFYPMYKKNLQLLHKRGAFVSKENIDKLLLDFDNKKISIKDLNQSKIDNDISKQLDHFVNSGKVKLSAKSRKFIFEKVNEDEYTFYPFGFVKIGDFEPEIPSEDKEIKQININTKIQNDKPPVAPVEEKKLYEPQYKSINKLKEGNEVEAVVTDFKHPMIYFKVFVEELKDYTYSLKYAAGLDVGTYCRVKITSINKKDPSKHSFSFIREI